MNPEEVPMSNTSVVPSVYSIVTRFKSFLELKSIQTHVLNFLLGNFVAAVAGTLNEVVSDQVVHIDSLHLVQARLTEDTTLARCLRKMADELPLPFALCDKFIRHHAHVQLNRTKMLVCSIRFEAPKQFVVRLLVELRIVVDVQLIHDESLYGIAE